MTIFRIIIFTIGIICILGGSIGMAYLAALDIGQQGTEINKKRFWVVFCLTLIVYICICFFLSNCTGYFE